MVADKYIVLIQHEEVGILYTLDKRGQCSRLYPLSVIPTYVARPTHSRHTFDKINTSHADIHTRHSDSEPGSFNIYFARIEVVKE